MCKSYATRTTISLFIQKSTVIIEAYTCDDIGTWQTCCVAYVTLSCLQVAQVVSGYVKCERGLYK